MPDWFVVWGVTIATIAAVIASQAMISGSFTLIAEAVRLNIWPKVTIRYPSDHKGQIYVPSVNLILYLGCMLIILIFRESSNMEAAYGLSINMTFIMTTILMTTFMLRKKINIAFIALFAGVYMVIEVAFLVGNISKIAYGGWLTLLLAIVLYIVMYSWFGARKIKNRFVKFVNIKDYFPILAELSEDKSVPQFASHLVYLTSANNIQEVEAKITYSIINKKPSVPMYTGLPT